MGKRTYRSYAVKNDAGAYGKDFEVEINPNTPAVKLADGTFGPEVKCPWTGITNTDPALGGRVVPVVVMHYEPPRCEDLRHQHGCGFIACNPKKSVLTDDDLRYTGEPSVVNCPLCKETDAFKKATGATLHSSYDVVIPESGVSKDGIPIVPEFPLTPEGKSSG